MTVSCDRKSNAENEPPWKKAFGRDFLMPLAPVLARQGSHRPPSLILSLFTLLCFLCMCTWVTKAQCCHMGAKWTGVEDKLWGAWWTRRFSLPLLPCSPVSGSGTHRRKRNFLKCRILPKGVCSQCVSQCRWESLCSIALSFPSRTCYAGRC